MFGCKGLTCDVDVWRSNACLGSGITHKRAPKWLRRWAEQRRTTKVRIAQRVAEAANPTVRFAGIEKSVVARDAAAELVDGDFIFLAADSMQSRLVFNALVHQYVIPGVEVGAKVQVDRDNGDILDVFSVLRPVLPISPTMSPVLISWPRRTAILFRWAYSMAPG